MLLNVRQIKLNATLTEGAEADTTPDLRYRMRRAVCWVFVILAGALCAYLGPIFYKASRHSTEYKRLETTIHGLSFHCPEDVTGAQWTNCILWSHQLVGNCASTASSMPTSEVQRIQEELETKINGGPDLETIDWLWDELVRYSMIDYQQYRPTLPDNKVKPSEFDNWEDELLWLQKEYEARSDPK